ncbi:hypothetical protein OAB57_00145 [Bacteriovoracaceae bacterium]|nr:hypothetical protein [Bacteriovoracaceae bacterium]
MKKSDKNTENDLIAALTLVCEDAQATVNGFLWITHRINYKNVPQSLYILCVFDTNRKLLEARQLHKDDYLHTSIKKHLDAIGISLKSNHKNIYMDTEENCDNEHEGDWNKRISHNYNISLN